MPLPAPYYHDGGVTLHHGDCRDVMAAMEPDSIDAILTDPPYGLSFMGRDWDKGVPGEHFWREAIRVAKPGAHMLAFGGTRTFHRLTCAIEDAGWEIRDCLMWLYGSGFPKSLDVSKAIDKEAGLERPVIGKRTDRKATPVTDMRGGNFVGSPRLIDLSAISGPASDESAQWSGWHTALKPSYEPVILCRKPLAKGHTVAANVLEYGTGAVNVDGCRIGAREERMLNRAASIGYGGSEPMGVVPDGGMGRFPANVLHDGSPDVMETFAESDRTHGAGIERSGSSNPRPQIYNGNVPIAPNSNTGQMFRVGDSGSAARFFYTAKASPADRGHGNIHPTVKPTDLLAYLARLITPPDGLILDPFCGSGSTAVATIYEGFRFVGIDLEAKYLDIARSRLSQGALFHTGAP